MDIDTPVQDSKGFVYSKAAIVDYLKKQGGQAQCPMQGKIIIIKKNG